MSLTVICFMVGNVTGEELLCRHHLLGVLEAGELAELLARARQRQYDAGQTVFSKEDPGDGLYGVLSGRVAVVSVSAAGKELILNRFGPGEFFGEIALLDGKGRTATAVVREPATLLFLGRNVFLPFLKRKPDVAIRMIALLCGRLRRTTEQVEDSAFLNVGARLAKALLALAGSTAAQRGAPGVEIGVSQSELAEMLGVSREIVSKQLAVWRRAGLVSLRRNRIVLVDPRTLSGEVLGG